MKCPNCAMELPGRRATGRCAICGAAAEGQHMYCVPCGREMRRLSWRTSKARAKQATPAEMRGWKEALAPLSIYSKEAYEKDTKSWFKDCRSCGEQFVYPDTQAGGLRRYCDDCLMKRWDSRNGRKRSAA